jgi:hypothetical protein
MSDPKAEPSIQFKPDRDLIDGAFRHMVQILLPLDHEEFKEALQFDSFTNTLCLMTELSFRAEENNAGKEEVDLINKAMCHLLQMLSPDTPEEREEAMERCRFWEIFDVMLELANLIQGREVEQEKAAVAAAKEAASVYVDGELVEPPDRGEEWKKL